MKSNLGVHRLVKHNVIAVVGSKSSGKDSFYNLWTESPTYPTANVKFAKPLNDFLEEVIGVEVDYNHRDDTFQISTKNFLEVLDKYFPTARKPEILTPTFHMSWRELAEWVGTELVRAGEADYFVKQAQLEVEQALDEKYMVMLTDVRFENELELASLVVGVKRDTDTRLEFDRSTPKPEKLGEFITVWSNRYMVVRDMGESYALCALTMLGQLEGYFNGLGLSLHEVYQTLLDADGELIFTPIQEAYNFNKEVSEEVVAGWLDEVKY